MKEKLAFIDEHTEAVIFDLGNVLLGYDWRPYLASLGYDDRTNEILAEAIFLNEDWERGDRGGITSQEWEQLFVENAPDYEKQIRRVYSGIEQTIYPLPYTERLVRFLKMRRLKLYYLSNYSEHLYKKTRQHMGFLEEFDGGLFSYEVLSIKPEEKIYRLLLDKYSIVPEKALFFDDRQVNTETASRLGIKGVVFEPDMAYHILDI